MKTYDFYRSDDILTKTASIVTRNERVYLSLRLIGFFGSIISKKHTNDLDLVNYPDTPLSKYADDTTMQVIVNKAGTDCASDVISQYLSWSSTNYMPCNLSKCK